MTSSKSKRHRPTSGTGPTDGDSLLPPSLAPQQQVPTETTDTMSQQPPKTPTASRPASTMALDRIGDILKRVREQRGEFIEEISEYLRIRQTYLVALEENRYEDLPADAYVIGFLRTYANYLGLDGRAAIDQYRKEMAGRRRKPHLTMPQPMSEGQAPSPTVLIGALVAALLVYILWYSLSGTDRTIETPPTISQIESVVPANQQNAATNGTLPNVTTSATPTSTEATQSELAAPQPQTQTTTPAPTPALSEQTQLQANNEAAQQTAPAAIDPKQAEKKTTEETKKDETATTGDNTLVIRAAADSWVSVTNSRGSAIYDHVMKMGETYKVPDQKGLRLTTGNAGGIVLNLNGKDLDIFEKNAHVVRNMPLDPEKLKE